jgi:hypothetical protein
MGSNSAHAFISDRAITSDNEEEQIMANIGIEAVASGPLEITYSLGPQGSVKTTVTGNARNVATIVIYNGSSSIYSGSMDQVAPDLMVPDVLLIGDMEWSNMSFHLSIPSAEQNGYVFMKAEIKDSTHPPRRFQAQIAMWQLSGEVS